MKSPAIKIFIAALFISHLFPFHARASAKPEPMLLARNDITELSLEELMDITVTSVSKKESKLSESAAAIFVITQEDIRRSGVNTIPDALRMVPGLQVAQLNSSTWAISVRGFNHRFANKLLVLLDGRTLYTPVFSGVYWHKQDTMLEDVERIEIIRGPGATLWGANAVNGIINIITKNAKDTQGGLLSGGGGKEETGFGSLRYGGELGDNLHYRAYAKGSKKDNFSWSSGENAKDDWDHVQGGFKVDWEANEDDSFTFQGDLYKNTSGDTENVTVPFSPFSVPTEVNAKDKGANILGRWKHIWSDTSDSFLQLYYDHTDSESRFLDTFGQVVRTYDVDFQHRFQSGDRQEITWGLGFRYVSDNMDNSYNISYSRGSRGAKTYNVFLQDEITVVPDRLKFILGSKFEDNDYSQFEVQPSGRILWTPHERHTLWASVSRAVRTPSRADHDLASLYASPIPANALFPGSPTALYTITGNKGFNSEDLLAYELGYRVQPMDQLSLDIAAFYNNYDNLLTFETGAPYPGDAVMSHLVIPAFPANDKMSGETYGAELSAQWRATSWWRFQASYTRLQIQLYPRGSTDPGPKRFEGTSPDNQFSLRSSMDLPLDLELDAFLRYVDNLPEYKIDGYTEMDIRLGWNPRKDLELSLVGRNLLNDSHPEFMDATLGVPVTEVERSVYGKVTWRF